MNMLLYNIALAFLWAMLTGEINSASLTIGYVVGYAMLGAMHAQDGRTAYFIKVLQVIRFLLFFLKEMIVSSYRVAYDIVTPTYHTKPGVIGIPLDARTDMEITLLANVITLTPGTLSLDISEDRKTLYIHAMFIDDPDTLRREIKDGLERRLLDVMR